jgi:hypothetical protein
VLIGSVQMHKTLALAAATAIADDSQLTGFTEKLPRSGQP